MDLALGLPLASALVLGERRRAHGHRAASAWHRCAAAAIAKAALIEIADKRLCRAEQRGRDRVVSA